jgi:two-component system, LytTR family, response regulator
MKAIIIDDEIPSADNLRILISENCPEVNIAAICHDAHEGIAAVRNLRPDLLFLDIEMPFADGFSVLREVGDEKLNVVFTTAFSEYAVRAFRVNACDYLLKPVDPEELRAAVEKAKNLPGNASGVLSRIEALEQHMQQRGRSRLAVQGVEGYSLIDYDEIIRLEASSNYTHIYCRNGKKHTVAKLLKDFEEQLSGEGFFRTHSSHLVNLSHVTKYLRGDGGYLHLSDGTQIEVSRSRKKEVLKVLLGEE